MTCHIGHFWVIMTRWLIMTEKYILETRQTKTMNVFMHSLALDSTPAEKDSVETLECYVNTLF